MIGGSDGQALQDVVTRIKIYQYSPHLPIIPQDEIKTSLLNIYTQELRRWFKIPEFENHPSDCRWTAENLTLVSWVSEFVTNAIFSLVSDFSLKRLGWYVIRANIYNSIL